jgi:hypothetical protein
MNHEVRTKRGKLVGIVNEHSGVLCIKDRSRETFIEIPPQGLKLRYTPGDGKIEEVYIPSRVGKPTVA